MDQPKYENKSFVPRPRQDVELYYVGEGRKVERVPPRDLNAAEVIRYGGSFYLVKTGLYAFWDQIKND